MRGDFHLVDLYSQGAAVNEHLAGWPAQQILEWLGTKGSLELAMPASRGGHDVYRFTSSIGRESCFFIDQEGLRLI